MRNLHPALPNLDQLQKNADEILTCLPLIATVKVYEQEIKILTWNLQASVEFKADKAKRFNWLLECLLRILSQNNLTFIALQDLDSTWLNPLCEKLNGWHMRYGNESEVTLCRSDDNNQVQFNNSVLVKDDQSIFTGLQAKGTLNGQVIELYNISKSNVNEIDKEENEIKRFLLTGHQHTIVIGNYNSPVVPCDDRERNLTTEVEIIEKEGQKCQIGLFRTGCFYSNSENNTIVIKQATMVAVDPATGGCMPEEPALEPDSTQTHQIEVYQPALCMGDYHSQELINGQPIAIYQEQLRTLLNDKSLAVVRMSNINNRKKFALNLDRTLLPLLESKNLSPSIQITDHALSDRVTLIFNSANQLDDFHKVVLQECSEVLMYKQKLLQFIDERLTHFDQVHASLPKKNQNDVNALRTLHAKKTEFETIKQQLVLKTSLVELKNEVKNLWKKASVHRVTTGIKGLFYTHRKTESTKVLEKIVDETGELKKTKPSRCCCF